MRGIFSHESRDIVEELRSRPRDTKLDTKPKQTSIDNSSWVRVQEFDTAIKVEYCGVYFTTILWFNQKDLAVQSSLISLREVWGGTHVWGITIQSCVFSGFNMFMIGDCIPLQTIWLSGTACILFWDIFEWFKSASNQFAKTCASGSVYWKSANLVATLH